MIDDSFKMTESPMSNLETDRQYVLRTEDLAISQLA